MRVIASILLALTVAFGATIRPAAADQAAVTRNIILGAAAVVVGATVINVAHKRAVANSVVGYTPDGSTVYADGHVVTSSGQSYYPGNYGQSVACNGQYCTVNGNGTYGGGYYGNTSYNGYNGYNGYNSGYDYGQGRWRRNGG